MNTFSVHLKDCTLVLKTTPILQKPLLRQFPYQCFQS